MELPPPDALAPLLGERVLFAGAMGTGKSTVVTALSPGRAVVTADPGQPLFGPPGAVSRARRRGESWAVERVEPLATFDVARFRLPLAMAVGRLAEAPGPLLVDAPGIVRGVAAGELLGAIAEAARVDTVVLLALEDEGDELFAALAATGARILRYEAPAAATVWTPAERAARRTARWDAWLGDAAVTRLPALPVVGPAPAPGCLAVALDERGAGIALAEVVAADADGLSARAASSLAGARTLVVRDVRRDAAGLLHTVQATAEARAGARFAVRRPPELALDLSTVRRGAVQLATAGGLFDDPFLMLRFVNEPRMLLFDLGDPGRLPTRLAHLVTDVFVSHAHMDHFSGFLWLLRCRIGVTTPCRVVGPPGLAERLASFVGGFTWDRIGENGPRFEVGELHGDVLRRVDVQAGLPTRTVGERPIADGVVLAEPAFRVRATTLDHGGLPVLAYLYEEARTFKVRADRLRARGLAPGPWLGELKRALHEGRRDAPIVASDGSVATAGALGDALVLEAPGRRVAYATDFADVPDNRARLADLARDADLFVCEASFAEADRHLATRTGHLTARACGEIAAAAGVAELVPFHFSRRYESDPALVVGEVAAAFPRTRRPR